jgi:hypothetical protein
VTARARHHHRERRRDICGVHYVKLSASQDDRVTIAFAGSDIHADHGRRLLL